MLALRVCAEYAFLVERRFGGPRRSWWWAMVWLAVTKIIVAAIRPAALI